MPNSILPPLKPMLSYKAEQTLQRIITKVRFLNTANRILNGGDNA